VWKAVGEWLDLDEEELRDVLPHTANFPKETLFSKEQLFK
jgi:hypothetical protein